MEIFTIVSKHKNYLTVVLPVAVLPVTAKRSCETTANILSQFESHQLILAQGLMGCSGAERLSSPRGPPEVCWQHISYPLPEQAIQDSQSPEWLWQCSLIAITPAGCCWSQRTTWHWWEEGQLWTCGGRGHWGSSSYPRGKPQKYIRVYSLGNENCKTLLTKIEGDLLNKSRQMPWEDSGLGRWK